MATIYRRRRKTLSKGECIFLGIFTSILFIILLLGSISTFIKGEINVAGLICMPLMMLPWPIYFFRKAKILAAAERKRREKFQEERQVQIEKAKLAQQQREAQAVLTKEAKKEQERQALKSRLRAAVLQETRSIPLPAIIISGSTIDRYTAAGDFVLTLLDGKLLCAAEAEAQGQILGKFEFRDRLWHFTNLAPENVEVNFSGQPPLAPAETCEVYPFPTDLLYHSGPGINFITMISRGWK